MLVDLQNALTLVTLSITVLAAVRNLQKILTLKFDDSAWAENHGKLLLEAVDPDLGDNRHAEMRRAIRLELERQQVAKLFTSRVNFSIWAPYLASFLCLAGMFSFAVVSGEFLTARLSFAGDLVCAVGSIWLMVLCARNIVLNAMLAIYARRQVETGGVRLPLERKRVRRNALGVDRLSQRQLWKPFKLEWTKQKRRRGRSGGVEILNQDLDVGGKDEGLLALKNR